MKPIILLLFLFLSACAKFEIPKDPRTVHGVDPEFQHYIDIYIYYKGRGLDYPIPMGFTDLPGDVVGMCTRFSDGHRQIVIDREYWEKQSSYNEKVSLIAHELGHCDLNRGHSDDPYSIMYEYNWGQLNFTELFNPDLSHYHKTDHNCVHDLP